MPVRPESVERSRTSRKWELFNEWVPLEPAMGPSRAPATAERKLLREMAKLVAEVSHAPQQTEKRDLWKRHNGLQGARPMILVFPEGSWREILPLESMTISDPFWRDYEWYLRKTLYRWDNLPDDYVIEPVLPVPLVYTSSGWGIGIRRKYSSDPGGSYAFDAAIKDPRDIEGLKPPDVEVDWEATRSNLQAVEDVFGDILDVRLNRRVRLDTSLVATLAGLRGLEQLMIDMIDRPNWVHEAMDILMRGTMRLLDRVEADGLLELNNRADYVGSGGLGYTDELPQPGSSERGLRLRDLWGFAEAQEYAHVSPAMHDEFALRYQIPLLARFGLNCYGCCEPLTRKFDIVKRIPRLRRVSVSPWADLRIAAEALGRDFILSWKPNPALLVGELSPDLILKILRDGITVTGGCVVEIILKDTHTVEGHPERLTRWVEIAREATACL
ncbi:MAG: hypothetical protein NUV93_00775 [Firmicutes bacterium]|nr:hypothetical protein [Bacillota bacterium]